MNPQTFYCRLYERFHNYKGIPPYILSPFRRIVRRVANCRIPQYFKKNKLDFDKEKSDIIVSLTSFPARIESVYLVIQCMLRQTILPNKIILWLSKEQFPDECLPNSLSELIGDFFEVRFVSEDIRSHKKYYYVMKENPHSWVLLIDDDLYYPADMIEQMIEARNHYHDTIICRYASVLEFDHNNIPPYSNWWVNETSDAVYNNRLFFGSGGGTLVKRDFFDKDLLDINIAMSLTPIGDDLWLNAMANLIGTNKFKIKSGLLLPILIKNDERLCWDNVNNNMNDNQVGKLVDYYSDRDASLF